MPHTLLSKSELYHHIRESVACIDVESTVENRLRNRISRGTPRRSNGDQRRHVALWVKNLFSGNFPQGSNALVNESWARSGNTSYCCLGVAMMTGFGYTKSPELPFDFIKLKTECSVGNVDLQAEFALATFNMDQQLQDDLMSLNDHLDWDFQRIGSYIAHVYGLTQEEINAAAA